MESFTSIVTLLTVVETSCSDVIISVTPVTRSNSLKYKQYNTYSNGRLLALVGRLVQTATDCHNVIVIKRRRIQTTQLEECSELQWTRSLRQHFRHISVSGMNVT